MSGLRLNLAFRWVWGAQTLTLSCGLNLTDLHNDAKKLGEESEKWLKLFELDSAELRIHVNCHPKAGHPSSSLVFGWNFRTLQQFVSSNGGGDY